MIATVASRLTSAFVEDAPPNLVGTLGAKLVDAAGTTVIARTTAGITVATTGDEWDYRWQFTAPTTPGFYKVVWDHGAVTFDEVLEVTGGEPPSSTFATLADLAMMLGVADVDDLTPLQALQGQMYLEIATGLITQAVGRSAEWAETLSPVPLILRAVTLTVAMRAMRNPTGARSESETLGQWSYSASYADKTQGLMLTDAEILLVRRAVFGRLSATSMPGTTLDHLIELRNTGEIAGFPAE